LIHTDTNALQYGQPIALSRGEINALQVAPGDTVLCLPW